MRSLQRDSLMKEIELLRGQLQQALSEQGASPRSKKVYDLSTQLDALIVSYMRFVEEE